MEKATIQFKGQVAELMEHKGKRHAKIICDTDNLLISIEDVNHLELGGDITIEGEIRIKSIQFEQMET
ncbi:MAG: hypothetical protein L3J31_01700 [Bacteroidales bacterium]|nr:hypothetical protein [Bacteroidales bacterium]MCF6341505.1 hypothetical protein [Bacteroidales bacterium]